MGRYLRLYGCFLRFSFSRAMEFRLDFFFRVGMDAFWYGIQLAFFSILYLHTDDLAGWSRDQALLFVGAMFVADAVNMTVFANNMWGLPIFVNKGDLDYHLVRPVSSLFMLSVRDFAANSFLNLLIAFGIMVAMLVRYPEPLEAWRVALFAATLGVGIFLHYLLNLLFILPVFWMHNASGLRELWFGLGSYVHRPDAIFRGWIRRILVSVLPLIVIVSFPARTLFDAKPWVPALHLLIVTVAFTALALWVWNRALRAYSSASS